MKIETRKATKNAAMLYLMNIAKMVFPLLTLPYLTRVLSVESYAVVTYEKAVMQYIQIFLMFGFSLSATKEIVDAKTDINKIGKITGIVLMAKGILSCVSFVALLLLIILIPLLQENPIYTMLSFGNVVVTEMLADFLFRGIDKMEVITVRFVVSKILSTALTFILIKNDSHMLFIPLFDILGSITAFFLVLTEIKKLGISIAFSSISDSVRMIKESSIYFLSDMATTAFGALNTLLIGIFLSKKDISYWGLCMQLISAVQNLYTPITNGIYPTMVRTKSISFIKKILLIFMPIVFFGCVLCYYISDFVVLLIGGAQYSGAGITFRVLIPVLLFSFPGMVLGWPTLGSINKQKEVTRITIISAAFQVVGLVLLMVFNKFTLTNLAILRCLSEFSLFILRAKACVKYRDEFSL